MELSLTAVAEVIQKNWPDATIHQPDEGVVFSIRVAYNVSLLHIMPMCATEASKRLGLHLWADFFHPDGRDVDWSIQSWENSLQHCEDLNKALYWCAMRAQRDPDIPTSIRPLIYRPLGVSWQDIVSAYDGDNNSPLLLGIMDIVREWNLVSPVVHALGDGTRYDCTNIDQLLHSNNTSLC